MSHGQVLVLNSSYEPLGLMSVTRAMCKISRADTTLQVLEWDDTRTLKTVKGEYPVPSVLRLTYYLNIIKRRNKSGAKRYKIYMRDQFRCGYCTTKVGKMHPELHRKLRMEDLTLDHIIPSSQDGKTIPENLVTACKPCNQKKRDRTPEEAHMPLCVSKTLLSTSVDNVILHKYAEKNPHWKKYIFTGDGSDDRYSEVG